MPNWNDQLGEAEENLEKEELRHAFLTAFGTLEICFNVALQRLNFESSKDREDSFGHALRALRDRRIIGDEEFRLAKHLADGRNVVAHKYGFEPSAREVRRTIDKVRRLCARFGKKVSDIMTTPVITASPDDIVGNLIQYFVRNGISLIPVIEGGRVIGTLSDTTVIEAWENGEGIFDPKTSVCQLMKPEVLPEIRPDASIEEAREMMIRKRIQALLVLNNRLPIGIITKVDLLQNLGNVS